MGRVIGFPPPPQVTIRIGNCPVCGSNDGGMSDGEKVWGICVQHLLKWPEDHRLFTLAANPPVDALRVSQVALEQYRPTQAMRKGGR